MQLYYWLFDSSEPGSNSFIRISNYCTVFLIVEVDGNFQVLPRNNFDKLYDLLLNMFLVSYFLHFSENIQPRSAQSWTELLCSISLLLRLEMKSFFSTTTVPWLNIKKLVKVQKETKWSARFPNFTLYDLWYPRLKHNAYDWVGYLTLSDE